MSGPTGNQKYVRKIGPQKIIQQILTCTCTCTCINILQGVLMLVKFHNNFQNYAYTVHVNVDV